MMVSNRCFLCWQDYEDGDEAELGAQLCSALCCLAEAKLGDEDAEVADVGEECERLLLRAADADPSSPEPMQVRTAACAAADTDPSSLSPCRFAWLLVPALVDKPWT